MPLNERAMLATLNISQWNTRRIDHGITQEVALSKGAQTDAGQYALKLSNAAVLTDIAKCAAAAGTRHRELTLPWGDNGLRILLNNQYFKYMQAMNSAKALFTGHTARLFQEWPSILAAEKISPRLGHGAMFNPAKYPALEDLKRRFSFRISILPLPDADDFRVKLSEEEEQRVREDMRQSFAETIQASSRDAWQRLDKILGHFAKQLAAYGPGVRLHDTVLTNLVDLVDILPGLNVTADPALDAVIAETREKLCGLSIEKLKDYAPARAEAASTAQAILDKMKDYYVG